MSFPTLDSRIFIELHQKLGDREYMSLEMDLAPEDKKILKVAYVTIEKSGASLLAHLFDSIETRNEFINNHLRGFHRI